MRERWKEIANYDGVYFVSNKGRVKNNRGMILSPLINKFGYASVILSKNAVRTQYYIHRLVATSFIKNPHNLPEVNHIDETKLNNFAENLEWCDRMYNCHYGTGKERNQIHLRKAVVQYSLSGEFIANHRSIMETGFTQSGVSRCINGEYNSSQGFIWRYK